MIRSSHRRRLNRAIRHLDGLLFYWPFDELSGDAINQAPNTLGTLAGTVDGATQGEVGVKGMAYDFDGNDDVEVVDNASLSPSTTGAFSVSFLMAPSVLVYSDSTGSLPEGPYVNFLGKGVANQHEWTFRIHDETGTKANMVSFYVWPLVGTGGKSADITSIPIVINDWLHIVGTYDGTNVYIYRNGVFKDSTDVTSITMEDGTASLKIGTRNDDSFFEGKIQHVAIFDRVLSAAQILSLAKITKLA